MKKIETTQIKRIMAEHQFTEYYYTVGDVSGNMPVAGIYHKNDWDHGYDGYTGFLGSRREFYKDYFEMLQFLKKYIQELNCSKCIIAPFKRYKQFAYCDKNNDIFVEIYKILRENKIRINSHAGLEISLENEFQILEAFIEGAFRGISLHCMYFTEIDVLLTPTHHFELPFWSYNIEEQAKVIKKICKNYDNLSFYQKYN